MPKLEYDHDADGNILLPDAPPFDGEPILVHLANGWVEAWWLEGITFDGVNGREDEGFCWVCLDADFHQELDDVDFWIPLPELPKAK
jgi:hypothetical protein